MLAKNRAAATLSRAGTMVWFRTMVMARLYRGHYGTHSNDLFRTNEEFSGGKLLTVIRRPVRDDWLPGMQFDPSQLHHAVCLFCTWWRLATLARHSRAFLSMSFRFSVLAP